MTEFKFDSVLHEDDLCNYDAEKADLAKKLLSGRRLVMYGRRNTGKTSILKSSVIPKLRKSGTFVLFADLYGVRSLEQIAHRLHLALETSLLESFPVSSRLKSILSSIKLIRPTLKTDPIEGITLSLDLNSTQAPTLAVLFKTFKELSKSVKVVIVLDEFQDIHFAPQAEGLLRDHFQNLPSDVGVIFLGSKKHILSKIFAKPNAPFAGFGEDFELPPISDSDYHNYIKERFSRHKIKITLEQVRNLKKQLQEIPEAVNIVCDQIIQDAFTQLDDEHIQKSIHRAVGKRQSRFEELLAHYTESEQKVMASLAKCTVIDKPSSTDFVAKTGVSQKGVSNIFKKLEDHAMIFRTPEGYRINDPLLDMYLRRFR